MQRNNSCRHPKLNSTFSHLQSFLAHAPGNNSNDDWSTTPDQPMPKHDLEEDLQSQPNKRVRFDKSERGHTHNGSEQVEEMIDVCRIAEREAKDPASQTVAWSRHNLLAKIVSTSPARIAFSLVPLKKRKPQKAEQKSTFSIPLILAPEEDPHHISFSPAGSHLLLAVGAPHRLRLVLYHITTSGCINDWQVAQEWHLRFHQEYPVKVSSFQWLSEPRQVSAMLCSVGLLSLYRIRLKIRSGFFPRRCLCPG